MAAMLDKNDYTDLLRVDLPVALVSTKEVFHLLRGQPQLVGQVLLPPHPEAGGGLCKVQNNLVWTIN